MPIIFTEEYLAATRAIHYGNPILKGVPSEVVREVLTDTTIPFKGMQNTPANRSLIRKQCLAAIKKLNATPNNSMPEVPQRKGSSSSRRRKTIPGRENNRCKQNNDNNKSPSSKRTTHRKKKAKV